MTKTSFSRLHPSAKLFCAVGLAMLWSSTTQAQILFDIDNASVSGGDVTQTVSVGGVNFELTASYFSGAGADLFNLDGVDDFAFFSNDTSLGANATGFRVSLTQGGIATNFDLDQIDFASFGNGHAFDLFNSNGSLITDDFSIPNSGNSGTIAIDNVANATNIAFFDVIGTSNALSTVQVDFHNIVLTPSAVPEPGSLFVLGMLSVGMLVRRQRR